MRKFTLRMIDGKELICYEWKDAKDPIAVIQLVHGAAEHLLRYQGFAQAMNEVGVVVVGDDHRGHGQSVSSQDDELGFFARHHGWEKIVDDEKMLNDYIHKKWPGKPVFMLGHSMGSFMARTYAIKYSETIDGLILMGTSQYSPVTLHFAHNLARLAQFFRGAKKPAKLIWKLSFKPLNKKYKRIPHANGNEWLTHDVKVQLEFKKDPYSSQIFTTSAFKDLFGGIRYISCNKNVKLMRKDLPIFILSGAADAAGFFGKGPKKVCDQFEALGFLPLLKLYPHLRHEILSEPEKSLVESDIINFVKKNLE